MLVIVLLSAFNYCSLTAISISSVFTMQVILLFFILTLSFFTNSLIFLSRSYLILVCVCFYMFTMHLDAFASFLLLAETAVFVFIFSIFIMYSILNLPNITVTLTGVVALAVLLKGSLIEFYGIYVGYYINNVSFNDLVGPYVYFFSCNPQLVCILASWLMLATFLTVMCISNLYASSISLNHFLPIPFNRNTLLFNSFNSTGFLLNF